MNAHTTLIGVALIVVLVIGAISPVVAHDTQEIEGYDVTVGGADEPLITGERMWLQVEIADNETGEEIENQADTLTVSIQKMGNEKTPLEVSESHGEPGVYEVAVIFREPGEYMLHLEGSIEGTEVHTHFETEVHDSTELEYPHEDSHVDESGTESDTDDSRATLLGLGSDVGISVVVTGVAMALGAGLVRRRR